MTVDELKALIAASPTKLINLTETVDVTDLDYLTLNGHELRSSANPMFRIDAGSWAIRDGKTVAEAGVTFDIIRSSHGLISGVQAQSWGYEVLRCVGNGSCFDTLVQACYFTAGPDLSVPIINISVVGGGFYNSNVFDTMRIQTKGNSGAPTVPAVIMECTAAANWIYGNRFSNINVEMPNAGFIRCGACSGTVLDNIVVYDANLAGPITDDIIWFGKSSVPGLNCIRTTIRNYSRLAGNLNAEKYDINFDGHYSDGVVLEQISSNAGLLRVKTVPDAVRIEVQDFRGAWVNI